MAYFREFSDVAHELSPMAVFLILGLIFLIASIGGWYNGRMRNKFRLGRRRPYFLSRSSPFSQPFVSVVHMGSGWPQSAQRSTRWLPPLASMSFIVFWHLGQTDGEDWI